MRFNVLNDKIKRDSNENMYFCSDCGSMINIMFVLLSKMTFSHILYGVNSKHFSLAPLAYLTLLFYVN